MKSTEECSAIDALATLDRGEQSRAGLLPEQRVARYRRSVAILEKYGQGSGALAHQLRESIVRIEKRDGLA